MSEPDAAKDELTDAHNTLIISYAMTMTEQKNEIADLRAECRRLELEAGDYRETIGGLRFDHQRIAEQFNDKVRECELYKDALRVLERKHGLT